MKGEFMDFDEAVEHYLAGRPVAEIAAGLGLKSTGSLNERLRKAGVPKREPFRRGRRKDEIPGLEEAAARYLRGEPAEALAAELGVDRTTLDRRLRYMGISPADRAFAEEPVEPRRARRGHNGNRKDLPDEEIAARYAAGESVSALAQAYGVSRSVITRRLDEAGVAKRNRAQAMSMRMKQTPPAERKRLAQAAHEVRRSMGDHLPASLLRARARERNFRQHLRIGEEELAAMLAERGYPPYFQKALGPYNVDLCVPPVAVEIHRSTAHPLVNPMYRERARRLIDAGWRIVFVWLNPLNGKQAPKKSAWALPTPVLADKIVAHLQAARRDPSSVSQYRVIRGSGEDAPFGSLDPDQRAVIPAPEGVPYPPR
ncbi:hypothetical protein [Streptomyces eurythermus]|uniref:hypothetical protein n=1 Tax=Streptomyces eurythermus TaxID=42237 RepID=UPI0036F82C46